MHLCRPLLPAPARRGPSRPASAAVPGSRAVPSAVRLPLSFPSAAPTEMTRAHRPACRGCPDRWRNPRTPLAPDRRAAARTAADAAPSFIAAGTVGSSTAACPAVLVLQPHHVPPRLLHREPQGLFVGRPRRCIEQSLRQTGRSATTSRSSEGRFAPLGSICRSSTSFRSANGTRYVSSPSRLTSGSCASRHCTDRRVRARRQVRLNLLARRCHARKFSSGDHLPGFSGVPEEQTHDTVPIDVAEGTVLTPDRAHCLRTETTARALPCDRRTSG
jgi:hypothetical protein